MRVAALDLGTNTFLLLLAEGNSEGITKIHSDHVEVVRLGQGVDKYKVFHPYALSRARTCFEVFKKHIDEFRPDKILAVATSAAREVSNGDKLFDLGREFGIPIEIIEGRREAEISFNGALVGFDTKNKDVAVIDIGGGSTEVVGGRDGVVQFAESLNIGGVRLTEKFISQQPVIETEKKEMVQFIHQKLEEFSAGEALKKTQSLYAVAGTPTTLAALEIGGFEPEKVDGFVFTLDQLIRWQETFATTTIEEKKEKFKLGGRADIIFAGTTILIEFLKKFEFSEVTISTKGVRYGVALQLLQNP